MSNLNQAQLVVLADEYTTDPLGLNYDIMDDATATASVNGLTRPSTQAILIAEWEDAIRRGPPEKWVSFSERGQAQTAPPAYDNPEMYQIMSVFGEVDSGFGSTITQVDLRGDAYWSGLLDAAVASDDLGAAAAEAMKALCDIMISRAVELSLPLVTEQDTINARAL